MSTKGPDDPATLTGAPARVLLGVVCPAVVYPVAPPEAQVYADQLTGYVLLGVLALFVVGVITGIGAVHLLG